MSNRKLRSGSSPDVDQSMFTCDTCGEKFWIKSKLDKHILSHAETVFSCNTCNESFSSYSDLDLHSRSHKRADQSNQCLVCKSQFEDRSELLYHHMTHPDHSTEKNSQPKTVLLERKVPHENVTSVPANFKNKSETVLFPKIVQVGTLLVNNKPEGSPIIFGMVGSPGSPKSNSSSSKMKPILKTSDTVTIQKVNRPLNWKDPVNIEAKQAKGVKRSLDILQDNPRKQQKTNDFANAKQGTMANISVIGQGVAQSQHLRLLKSSPMSKDSNVNPSGEKCKMPPAAPTVIRVGETTLSPIVVQGRVIDSKQMPNPVGTVLPNQLNPTKGLTVSQVQNAPEKKVLIESPNISITKVKTTNSPKIVINLPQQGGFIQPGQQLISADIFAGKTFIIQKSTNTTPKSSSNNAGNQAQFVKQRVLINPVSAPKPPVQFTAVQPVVLASPGQQLLSSQKQQQDNLTISKSTDPQNAVLASSPVNSKTPKRMKSPQVKRLNLPKAKSPEKMPLSAVESLSQNSSTSIASKTTSSPRSAHHGKKYARKKISSDSLQKNKEDAIKLSQGKIKLSPKKMNLIGLENLASLKVVLPTILVKKLPDSVYEECIKNGFITIMNLGKIFLNETKKAQKMKSKDTIKMSPNAANDLLQDVKATESFIGKKEKIPTTARKTRSAIKGDSDVEIHNANIGAETLKAVKNISSLNVQDSNMESSKLNLTNSKKVISSRKSKNLKSTTQGLLNRQPQSIKSDGLNFGKDDNLSSPTLKETRQTTVNVATPVLPAMKTKKPVSIGDETVVSLLKRYSRKSVNPEKVDQISATVQVQNMKTSENVPVQSIKSSDIVPVPNVKTTELNSKTIGIANSPTLASSISKPIASPSSTKVMVVKAGKIVNTKELNSATSGIASSPTFAKSILKPISPPSSAKVQIVKTGTNVNTKGLNSTTSRIASSPALASSTSKLITPASSTKVQTVKTVTNVNAKELNWISAIASSPSVSNISKPISSPSSAKVQIVKPGENFITKELNLVNDKIVSSPALENPPPKSTPSTSAAPSNVKVVPVTADFMKKLKDSLLKSTPCPESNNIRVVVPSEVLSKIQVPATQTSTSMSIKTVPEHSVSSVITPVKVPFRNPPKNIVKNFEHVEEMLEEEKKKKEEKEIIKRKEKILKKMLVKYEEKEEKKQVKYFQKKLSRFIEKNREHLVGSEEKLYEVISNSSKILEELKGLKHATETEIVNQLVTNVMLKSLMDTDSSEKSVDEAKVKKERQKKSVQGFVNVSTSRAQKKCVGNPPPPKGKNASLKKVSVSSNPKSKNVFSSALSSENVYVYDATNETRLEDKTDKASYSKSSNNTKKVLRKRSAGPKKVIRPFQEDPFTDMSIITGERFTIECPCQNENCDGLHPELTFF